MTNTPPSQKIILYGHAACFGVPPARQMLQQSGAPFEYVDIHLDAAAAATVRGINHGHESVPTLLFPDGSTLTEPSAWALRRKLLAQGYQVGLGALFIGNIRWIVLGLGLGLLLTLLRSFEVF